MAQRVAPSPDGSRPTTRSRMSSSPLAVVWSEARSSRPWRNLPGDGATVSCDYAVAFGGIPAAVVDAGTAPVTATPSPARATAAMRTRRIRGARSSMAGGGTRPFTTVGRRARSLTKVEVVTRRGEEPPALVRLWSGWGCDDEPRRWWLPAAGWRCGKNLGGYDRGKPSAGPPHTGHRTRGRVAPRRARSRPSISLGANPVQPVPAGPRVSGPARRGVRRRVLLARMSAARAIPVSGSQRRQVGGEDRDEHAA